MHAPGVGIVALSQVRSCAWRRTQYHLGIEFLEKAAISPQESAAAPDHHELLRAGVTGHTERVDQLYRALAFRYHPDNPDNGDSEVFLRIREAYRILSVSDKKVAVLGMLLQKRMGDYRNAVASPTELESATGLAADEVGFILWYLREKGAVTMCDNSSDYAISARSRRKFRRRPAN